MKISLGIDFNKIRTIVSYYEEKSQRIRTIYNEPSCGIIMKKGMGQSFYGSQALNKEGVGYSYTFYPTLFVLKEEILNPYFNYLISNVIQSLEGEVLEIEYIVISSGSLDFKIKDLVFPYLKNEFKELKKTKLIFSKSKELLNFTIVKNLNNTKKIDEENILVLSLNDDIYQASLFNYQKNNLIPSTLTPINISYSGINKFGIGSYELILNMMNHAIEKQAVNVKANYKINEMNFSKYKLLCEIENRFLSLKKDLSLVLKDKLTFNYYVNKEKYQFVIDLDDYEYALSTVLYGKNDSIRKYLKDVKNKIENTTYKVLLYGKVTLYSEVVALIQSIFGKSRIIPFEKVSLERITDANDFNYVSLGALYESSMRYLGVIPKVSYKNYLDMNVAIINKNDNFILSESQNGSFFYRLNKDFEIPLKPIINSKEEGYYIYINDNQINLLDYLYNRGSLNSNSLFDKKFESFIASVRMGLKNIKDKTYLSFELDCQMNKYHYEFEIEVK